MATQWTQVWKSGSLMGRTLHYGKGWCKMCEYSKDKSKQYDTTPSWLWCPLKSGDIYGRNRMLHHADELGWKRLFQHGKRNNDILIVGETSCRLREEILFVEAHINQTLVQYEDARKMQRPPTSTPSIGCWTNSTHKGLTLKKKLRPLPSFRGCRRVGRYSILHSPTIVWISLWMKQSDKS